MYLTLLHTEFQKQEYKSVYQGDWSCQNYTSFYVNLECITKSNTNSRKLTTKNSGKCHSIHPVRNSNFDQKKFVKKQFLITHQLYDPTNFWFRMQALPQIDVVPERYPMINRGNINWNSQLQKILLTFIDLGVCNILYDTKNEVW